MKNKKVKQMLETLTGGKYQHLRKSGNIGSTYCLRKQGAPVTLIQRGE